MTFKKIVNKVHLGDMKELIKKIPDESIDCIVSDIPYKIIAGGVRIEQQNDECSGILNKRTDKINKVVYDNNKIGKKWIKKNGGLPCAVKQGKMFANNDIQFEEYLPELYRVLKKETHCYLMINSRNLAELQNKAEEAGFVFQNLLAWIKNNVTPNKYYMQGMEFILMLSKRPARNINNLGSKNYFMIKNEVGKKQHPSQKPIALMKKLIENSTNRGDIVLDPFVGSGSTILACIQSDRKFIGFEIDEFYYEISKQRIREVRGDIGLFANSN